MVFWRGKNDSDNQVAKTVQREPSLRRITNNSTSTHFIIKHIIVEKIFHGRTDTIIISSKINKNEIALSSRN